MEWQEYFSKQARLQCMTMHDLGILSGCVPKCTRQGLNDPMIRALPPDTSGIYERTKKAR